MARFFSFAESSLFRHSNISNNFVQKKYDNNNNSNNNSHFIDVIFYKEYYIVKNITKKYYKEKKLCNKNKKSSSDTKNIMWELFYNIKHSCYTSYLKQNKWLKTKWWTLVIFFCRATELTFISFIVLRVYEKHVISLGRRVVGKVENWMYDCGNMVDRYWNAIAWFAIWWSLKWTLTQIFAIATFVRKYTSTEHI